MFVNIHNHYARFPHGLSGTYYSDTEWQAIWKKDILDTEISSRAKDFWRATQYLHNRFSIEWKGYIDIIETAEYTFFTNSDDGSWLSIDAQLVVDNGNAHGLQEAQGRIDLAKGIHSITIRYVQAGGIAALHTSFMQNQAEKKTSFVSSITSY